MFREQINPASWEMGQLPGFLALIWAFIGSNISSLASISLSMSGSFVCVRWQLIHSVQSYVPGILQCLPAFGTTREVAPICLKKYFWIWLSMWPSKASDSDMEDQFMTWCLVINYFLRSLCWAFRLFLV